MQSMQSFACFSLAPAKSMSHCLNKNPFFLKNKNWPRTWYAWNNKNVQVILFEIDCTSFYTNLHELFFQFISWTNWVNSGKFMDNCWISCQVMSDMEKIYDDLIIINLYQNVFRSIDFFSIRNQGKWRPLSKKI